MTKIKKSNGVRIEGRLALVGQPEPPRRPEAELVGVETEPGNRCSWHSAREAPTAERRAAEEAGAGGGRSRWVAVVRF